MEIANRRGDSRSADDKSLLEGRLADLQATVRHRQKDWAAALAAAVDPGGNLAQVVRRERAARIALERQLADRQAQYEIDIARAEAVRAMIDEQIREAAVLVEHARHAEASAVAEINRLRRAEADAVVRLAEREEQFASELLTTTAIHDALEQQLSDAESALESARHRHALAAAEVERLARREEELRSQYVAEVATRATLEQRIADVEAALLEASEELSASRTTYADLEKRHESEMAAAAAVLAERETELTALGAEAAAIRSAFERRVIDAESALSDAQRQHRAAMADAAARLAEREARFETELSSITAIRDRLEEQLRDVEARLTLETESRAALEQVITELHAAAAAAEQAFRDEISTIIERARTERTRLEDQMSRERHGHQIRLADEQQQHRSAIATAASRLAEREAWFEAELTATRAQAIDIGTALERRAIDAENALSDTQEQHRAAMADVATQLAEREAQLKAELSSITAARDGVEQQLRDVEARLTLETETRTALEQAITELRAAAAAAEQTLRDEIGTITEHARTERARLEDQISRERHDHQSQLADEQQQHQSAMAGAAARLAEREAQFNAELSSITAMRDGAEQQLRDVEARLKRETESRTAVEQALTELRAAAAAAQQALRDEIGTITERARTERARLDDQISRERNDHQLQLADERQRHQSAIADAATLLAEREAQFKSELSSITASRDAVEQQLQNVEARLTLETESRTALEQALTELHAAAAAAEQTLRDEIGTITEHARTERTRLEAQISSERHDHQTQLADEQQQHRTAMAAAATRLAEREAQFKAELARISAEHADALATVQAAAAERDSRLARSSAELRSQLDASEAENRRQFEQTPVPLIRCTGEGTLAEANQAFAALVGCRTPGELRDRNFAAARFECLDDLAWLIERSIETGKTESVETACVAKNGTRIAVRLSARPSALGLTECAVEDLTAIRVLEERLREAHRMESVGRLAREIAVTCGKQLRDVYRDAQRLLPMTGTGAPHRSERLLDEVTRVGGLLSQLVSYGQEQAAALAPVDVNRIVGHLEPVLQQVAGDAVTLELRKGSSPVYVDVTAERVERLLVNVASYGHERMPHGGRLRIELSTVVVDGKFIAQHPNVRQGPHALITMIEVPGPAPEREVSEQAGKPDVRFAAARPGVDLGVLQELIAECGGHLWITAEPGGSMVVKMRLPLRAVWTSQADGRARHRLGRATARLFGR